MNRAAEIGPLQFKWWPDWRGECVAIVAGGPSVKGMDLSILRDRVHVIAIKTSVDLIPWAEVCYGCDAAWWLDRKGLPKFRGVKIAHGTQATSKYGDIRRVEVKMQTDGLLTEQPMVLGNGGNSGHQALNLAVQFGATDIILIGYDAGADPNHLHWYGRNKWPNASNPAGTNFARWIKGFELARKDLDRMGVTVINASPDTRLKCFCKVPLAEVMAEWGL